MRQQIAQVLYRCAGDRDTAKYGTAARPPFEKSHNQELWLALADAALDALMEPTDAMQSADPMAPPWGEQRLETWQAMLRAAKDGK